MSTRAYGELSLWLEQVGPIEPRASLEGAIEADVAIIGAGFTGLWTAYYLTEHRPDLRVVVLERAVAGAGASGRNGGFCLGELNGDPARYAARGGQAATEALLREAAKLPDVIADVLDREGIDAGLVKAGVIALALTPGQRDRALARLDERRNGLPAGEQARWLDREEVERHLRAPGVLGATYVPHGARVHPARLVRGLAEAVARRGVTIFEHSPVTAWEEHRLLAPGGSVTADAVVRATEGYSEGIPGNGRRLLAFTSQIVATEPLDAATWERIGLAERQLVTSDDRLFIYMQRTVDDRIALGGRYTYRPSRPTASDAEPRFRVARNFALLEQAVRQLFPAAAGARITHRWGGIWGASRDFCPTVRFDPARRVGWAGGYGDGVGASNLSGRTLADLVLGRDTELAHSPWVGQEAGPWPPEPVTRAATWAISTAFGLADAQERRRGSAPGWVRAFERLVPK